MPLAWRIVKSRYAAEAFNGEGARLYGGRWTSIGRAVVYTSGTLALATLEMLVHLDSSLPFHAYSVFEVRFPDRIVADVALAALPDTWKNYPAPAELRVIGDRWLDELQTAVLRAPSAVVGVESNYLLNPIHPDFRLVTVGPERPHDLDPRLI